jgi:hypothetical protein
MSDNSNLQQEEIDLGTLFSQIGKMFKGLFNTIGHFFKLIFHYGILLILFVRKNYIVIGIVTLLGVLLGVFKDYNNVAHYESEMIIETNFGSANQLYKQIANLNQYILDRDSVKIAKMLHVSPEQAAIIKAVSIEPVDPEKQLLHDYDTYMQETDTIYTKGFMFEDFKLRRSELDLRLHKVIIKGKNKIDYGVFSNDFANLASNYFYRNLKDKYISELKYHKNKLVDNINYLDTLKVRYKKVDILRAENIKKISDLNFSTSRRKEINFDMDLNRWSMEMFNDLTLLNKKIRKFDAVSRVVADFGIGVKVDNKTWLKTGLFSFLIALFVLSVIQFNKYLNRYEKSIS